MKASRGSIGLMAGNALAVCPVCYNRILVYVLGNAQHISSHWTERMVSRDGVTWRSERTGECDGSYQYVEQAAEGGEEQE